MEKNVDFHSLPRRELQALCKKHKIPANMTNVAMADALGALFTAEASDETHVTQEPETSMKVNPPPQNNTTRRATRSSKKAAAVKEEGTEMKEIDGIPLIELPDTPAPPTGRKTRSRGTAKTPTNGKEEVEHEREEEKEALVAEEALTSQRRAAAKSRSRKVVSFAVSKGEGEGGLRFTKEVRQQTPMAKHPHPEDDKEKSTGVGTRRSTRLSSQKSTMEEAAASVTASGERRGRRSKAVTKMVDLSAMEERNDEKETPVAEEEEQMVMGEESSDSVVTNQTDGHDEEKDTETVEDKKHTAAEVEPSDSIVTHKIDGGDDPKAQSSGMFASLETAENGRHQEDALETVEGPEMDAPNERTSADGDLTVGDTNTGVNADKEETSGGPVALVELQPVGGDITVEDSGNPSNSDAILVNKADEEEEGDDNSEEATTPTGGGNATTVAGVYPTDGDVNMEEESREEDIAASELQVTSNPGSNDAAIHKLNSEAVTPAAGDSECPGLLLSASEGANPGDSLMESPKYAKSDAVPVTGKHMEVDGIPEEIVPEIPKANSLGGENLNDDRVEEVDVGAGRDDKQQPCNDDVEPVVAAAMLVEAISPPEMLSDVKEEPKALVIEESAMEDSLGKENPNDDRVEEVDVGAGRDDKQQPSNDDVEPVIDAAILVEAISPPEMLSDVKEEPKALVIEESAMEDSLGEENPNDDHVEEVDVEAGRDDKQQSSNDDVEPVIAAAMLVEAISPPETLSDVKEEPKALVIEESAMEDFLSEENPNDDRVEEVDVGAGRDDKQQPSNDDVEPVIAAAMLVEAISPPETLSDVKEEPKALVIEESAMEDFLSEENPNDDRVEEVDVGAGRDDKQQPSNDDVEPVVAAAMLVEAISPPETLSNVKEEPKALVIEESAMEDSLGEENPNDDRVEEADVGAGRDDKQQPSNDDVEPVVAAAMLVEAISPPETLSDVKEEPKALVIEESAMEDSLGKENPNDDRVEEVDVGAGRDDKQQPSNDDVEPVVAAAMLVEAISPPETLSDVKEEPKALVFEESAMEDSIPVVMDGVVVDSVKEEDGEEKTASVDKELDMSSSRTNGSNRPKNNERGEGSISPWEMEDFNLLGALFSSPKGAEDYHYYFTQVMKEEEEEPSDDTAVQDNEEQISQEASKENEGAFFPSSCKGVESSCCGGDDLGNKQTDEKPSGVKLDASVQVEQLGLKERVGGEELTCPKLHDSGPGKTSDLATEEGSVKEKAVDGLKTEEVQMEMAIKSRNAPTELEDVRAQTETPISNAAFKIRIPMSKNHDSEAPSSMKISAAKKKNVSDDKENIVMFNNVMKVTVETPVLEKVTAKKTNQEKLTVEEMQGMSLRKLRKQLQALTLTDETRSAKKDDKRRYALATLHENCLKSPQPNH